MKTIDYARMRKEAPRLKRLLTSAQRSGEPAKVVEACKEAVRVWDEIGSWPDNWHTWNIALHDAAYTDAYTTGEWSIPQTLDDLRSEGAES